MALACHPVFCSVAREVQNLLSPLIFVSTTVMYNFSHSGSACSYTSAPPIMNNDWFTEVPCCANRMASVKFDATRQSGAVNLGFRVRIMLVRLGSALPMLSKVLRPMMTHAPVVVFLKNLRSSGKCQGRLLLSPSIWLLLMATINAITNLFSWILDRE